MKKEAKGPFHEQGSRIVRRDSCLVTEDARENFDCTLTNKIRIRSYPVDLEDDSEIIKNIKPPEAESSDSNIGK